MSNEIIKLQNEIKKLNYDNNQLNKKIYDLELKYKNIMGDIINIIDTLKINNIIVIKDDNLLQIIN
jgi:hypothetical protein